MKPLVAAVLAVVLAAVPGQALGHVALVSSSPEAGANLNAAPSEVVLAFDGELDPARSGFRVLDQGGAPVGRGEVDLDVADRNVLAGRVDISEPGVYTVEWSVRGIDGHEISGSFSFGYATDEAVPEGEAGHGHDSPDTALPASQPGRSAAVLAGIGLLALASVGAVRRLPVR